jgi:hypothetical protein
VNNQLLFEVERCPIPASFRPDPDRCARCLTAIQDEFYDRCHVCGGEEVV